MKKKISEAVADAWGVPKDVMMNIPRFTVSGDREIYIENHKGIVRYTGEEIVISTPMGEVVIRGRNLVISCIRREDVFVTGIFSGIEYKM